MAEIGVVLVPILFEDIFKKLRILTSNEFCSLRLVAAKEFEKFVATVEHFQHMLQKEEVKQPKSAAIRDWFYELMHVANEADEILEDALDPDNDDQRPQCHLYYPPFFESNRHNFCDRIIAVIENFDFLDAEKRILDLGDIDINRETGSTSLSETQVFERIEAKEEITNAILNKVNIQASDPPFIYAIIGLGGIGKTTLVQYIYNDEEVVEHFDARIWVWVSETFDVKKVMRKIIQHFEKTNFESLETMQSISKKKKKETMQSRLKQLLNEKKFLLVLDDIWSEDVNEWNKLKSSLNCGAIGSSILLTTRQSNLASIVGAHDHHNIALSEDLCWRLFKESSSLGSNQENRKLEEIGKQIVKKCGGLPIAAKKLGGSLRLTREASEWESVRDSRIWEVERSDDIPPALKLSLDLLESHSKHCFAFSSVFPKGYAMNKEYLIHLWMANDLIPSGQGLELEDMGNKIVDELVLKSFFDFSRDCIKMHDLMHDLGRSLRNDCFCLDGPHVTNISPHILHLSINCPYQKDSTLNILETLTESHPSLHTCILFNGEYTQHSIKQGGYIQYCLEQTIFKNLDFHCFRALDLSQTIMKELPVSIEKFKQLKYLNLAGTYLKHVPDSICTLTTLQTLKLGGSRRLTHLPDGIVKLINLCHLDLRGCDNLRYLPVGISKMTNLRHLDISFCSKLTQLPNEIGQLVYLQTLGLFIVGEKSGQRIAELQGLNHLRGSLEIRGLEHVRDAKEADKAILKEKKNMSSLSLIWGDLEEGYSSDDLEGLEESNNCSDDVEGVLEALQPPQSLNGKLVIEGYGGSVFGSWMRLLEKLVEIELRDCIKCKRLPALGQLPHLKVLSIVGMKSLKCIGIEFYGSSRSERRIIFPSREKLKFEDMQIKSLKCVGTEFCGSSSSSERKKIFPSLEKLEFEDMPILEEWHPSKVSDSPQTCPFPRLKKLTLRKCPKLTLLPSPVLSFVQELDTADCDKVIVRSLSCLTSLTLCGKNTDRVMSLPNGSLQNLDALKFLEIKSYYNLTDLPEGFLNLTSLRTLRIHSCRSLKSLSQALRNLSSLESLTIRSCDLLEFSSWDFHNLISLQTLQVCHLPGYTYPIALQNLSSLQSLSICDCKNILFAPRGMQNLTVLENLTFSNCERLELSTGDFQCLVNLRTVVLYGLPKLTSLPEMHHIHSLQDLCVIKCKNFQRAGGRPKHLNFVHLSWIDKGYLFQKN